MTVYLPEVDGLNALTSRTFVVVDFETTADEGGPQRAVELGYVTIRGGRRAGHLSGHALVRPPVPISRASYKVHGIDDARAATAEPFATAAVGLLAALADPTAIFVAHNAPYDAAVLRNECALAGLPVPDRPVLDTMTLPAALGYARDGLGRQPSLELLAQALPVTVPSLKYERRLRPDGRLYHHARDDAELCASLLLALLAHAATHGTAVAIDELLAEHSPGTTAHMTGSAYIGRRATDDPYAFDPIHLARHTGALLDPRHVTPGELDDWLDRAQECARMLCPLLQEECAAFDLSNPVLFTQLDAMLPALTEPGQRATLLGVLMRALTPQQRREVQWWRGVRDLIQNAPRCEPKHACPDCRSGQPCPLDVAHEYAAGSLLVTPAGEISDDRLSALCGRNGDIEAWADTAPELAGHVAWLTMRQYVRSRQPQRASAVLALAETLRLQRYEPWLAIRVAEQLTGRGHLEDALDLLASVTTPVTTNPAQVAAASALARLRTYAAELNAPTDPRRQPSRGGAPAGRYRPASRRRPNPYRVGDYTGGAAPGVSGVGTLASPRDASPDEDQALVGQVVPDER